MTFDWNIGFGNILTIAALLLSFWGAHRANVARIEKSADRLKDIEVKVEILYRWFERTWGTPEAPKIPPPCIAAETCVVEHLETEKRARERKSKA
jgi:hypothetical protein